MNMTAVIISNSAPLTGNYDPAQMAWSCRSDGAKLKMRHLFFHCNLCMISFTLPPLQLLAYLCFRDCPCNNKATSDRFNKISHSSTLCYWSTKIWLLTTETQHFQQVSPHLTYVLTRVVVLVSRHINLSSQLVKPTSRSRPFTSHAHNE